MIRKIIRIDEEKCSGCGLCAAACHEGAIEMTDGKARLTKEDHCDGLGDCLPACPVDAISFEEREAPAYDMSAVLADKQKAAYSESKPHDHHTGCPGSMPRSIQHGPSAVSGPSDTVSVSELRQWPCQIKLIPINAPYFDGADLLVAADCTAYAYADMHRELMRGKITLIGCPKLDGINYSEKLTAIVRDNEIRSVTVARMEVPCCGGLEMAVKKAVCDSGKSIPCNVVIITVDGNIKR